MRAVQEHLHHGATNPQIAYDKEFAKSSISTAESYRKSAHKSIKFASIEEALQPQICRICVDTFSIAAKFYGGTLPFLFFRSTFRGALLADRALCAENRAEIGAICKAKARQATPPCAPRYSVLPQVRTTRHASHPPELLSFQWRQIRCTSCHAARAGVDQSKGKCIWPRRSWRHPRIQSSARSRQVRPSRWVSTSSSRRRTHYTRTRIPALRAAHLRLRALSAVEFKQICKQF
jgi:hypothetical protein